MATERSAPSKPAIEWVVGIASAAGVATLVGFLVWQAIFADPTPPLVDAAVERVDRHGGASAVTVLVTNHGSEAAAAVRVGATVQGRRREVELDYVAGGGRRRVTFLVPADTTAEAVALDVAGYSEP